MDEYQCLTPGRNTSVLFHQDLRRMTDISEFGVPQNAEFFFTLSFLGGILTGPAIGKHTRADITFAPGATKSELLVLIYNLDSENCYYTKSMNTGAVLEFTFRAIFTGVKWLVMISPEQEREVQRFE